MSTTTIRLPDELRARVESVAAASGSTSHAFMLEAIADATERMERRQDFEAEAERRLAEYHRTGEYHTLEDMRAYVLARARGEDPPKPPLRKDPAVVARSQRRR